MQGGSSLLFLVSTLVLLAGTAGAAAAARERGGSLAEDLRAIGQRRVYFGHQSVGGDILAGLRELAREEGVALDIVEAGAGDAPGLVHEVLGENTRPETKLDAFSRALDRRRDRPPELALLKFCYVDFEAATDVPRLFARYLDHHAALRERFPEVTFVHVTVPLTATQGGVRGFVKRVFGDGAAGERENVRRHQFNELLRARFAGREPIFDLALAESTREDGTPVRFEREGQAYPRLAPEFTHDGGHLNERGRRHVARALVEALARVEP